MVFSLFYGAYKAIVNSRKRRKQRKMQAYVGLPDVTSDKAFEYSGVVFVAHASSDGDKNPRARSTGGTSNESRPGRIAGPQAPMGTLVQWPGVSDSDKLSYQEAVRGQSNKIDTSLQPVFSPASSDHAARAHQARGPVPELDPGQLTPPVPGSKHYSARELDYGHGVRSSLHRFVDFVTGREDKRREVAQQLAWHQSRLHPAGTSTVEMEQQAPTSYHPLSDTFNDEAARVQREARRNGKSPMQELMENQSFHSRGDSYIEPQRGGNLHMPPGVTEMSSNRQGSVHSLRPDFLAPRPSMIPGNLDACTCLVFHDTTPFRIRTAAVFNGFLLLFFDKRKQWEHLCISYCDDEHHAVNLRDAVVRVSQRRRHAHHYVNPWIQARSSTYPVAEESGAGAPRKKPLAVMSEIAEVEEAPPSRHLSPAASAVVSRPLSPGSAPSGSSGPEMSELPKPGDREPSAEVFAKGKRNLSARALTLLTTPPHTLQQSDELSMDHSPIALSAPSSPRAIHEPEIIFPRPPSSGALSSMGPAGLQANLKRTQGVADIPSKIEEEHQRRTSQASEEHLSAGPGAVAVAVAADKPRVGFDEEVVVLPQRAADRESQSGPSAFEYRFKRGQRRGSLPAPILQDHPYRTRPLKHAHERVSASVGTHRPSLLPPGIPYEDEIIENVQALAPLTFIIEPLAHNHRHRRKGFPIIHLRPRSIEDGKNWLDVLSKYAVVQECPAHDVFDDTMFEIQEDEPRE